MLKTTQEKKEVVRDFYFPFDFRGNVNNVKVRSSKGDGEIKTQGGKETWARLTADLLFFPDEKKVRLSVNYKVEEQKGDYSILEFDAEQDYSIEGFYKEGELAAHIENNEQVKRGCTSTLDMVGSYNRSYIMTSFLGECHGYMTPQPWDHAQAERANPALLSVFPPGRQREELLSPYFSILQPWLPAAEIEMKVDDSGNELNGSGNIGVKGNVKFTVKRVDTITVTTLVDDNEQPTPPPSADSEKTTGSETKLDSIPDNVSSILGHGYDACGCYADTNSVKVPRVIDINEVNNFQRLAKKPVDAMCKYTNSGESLKEYKESLASNVHMGASIAAFGGFAKAETERSFQTSREEHTCDRYASLRSIYRESEYAVSYYSPSQLVGFLTQDFKNALNTLSAKQFIDVFGTHVILGMALGTRFTFSMKFRESSRKRSKAKSFKDSAEVGYKKTGEIEMKQQPEEKSQAQKIFEYFTNDGELSAEEVKAYTEFFKASKEDASKPSPDAAIDSKLYWEKSQSESWSSSEEEKSTVTKCLCVGGDAHLGELINDFNDTTYLPKWVESNKTNCVFCDFVPGQLIPIYEFIPTGYKLTADDVKRAFEEHMTWGIITHEMESRIAYCEFNTMAEANTESVQTAESSDHDEEIGTKSGKETFWKIQIELLNFDEGKCGFGISFIVMEGGSSGPASILKNTFTKVLPLELGFKQMSINTDYFGGSHFEAEATWTGEFHGWHDATGFVLKGTAGNVLCQNGNIVQIMIDDKGSDKGHIGVKGTIMIPWIGY